MQHLMSTSSTVKERRTIQSSTGIWYFGLQGILSSVKMLAFSRVSSF